MDNYFSFMQGAKSANSELFKDFCNEAEMEKNYSKWRDLFCHRSLFNKIVFLVVFLYFYSLKVHEYEFY